MEYHFGKGSTKVLNTLHKDLRLILLRLIKTYDTSLLEGLRETRRQQQLFALGNSTLDGVTKLSKHQPKICEEEVAGHTDEGQILRDEDGNPICSEAVDMMPWKTGTNGFSGKVKDGQRFFFMMGIVHEIAEDLLKEGEITHGVRFGLDWDSDDRYDDQNFDDLPHLELVKIK